MSNETDKNEIEEEKQGFVGELLDWLEAFIFAVFIVLLIFIFIFRSVVVDGTSMLPTLENAQQLILVHFNYKPKRGDIIVANSPGLNKTIIKRCIGVAGDTVIIDYSDSSVTVNGDKLEETYLGEPMQQIEILDPTYQTAPTVYEYHVPEGTIFAMGDNRNGSRDSRAADVGFISEEDVLGRAVFRFAPLDKLGKLE